jgi:chromate transporter
VELLLFFLKVGSVLFGSGYVLIAYLKRGLIEHHGWLTNAQLMDAITIGQVTPGPVFTTATFVGYLVNGFSGASLSTLGIFLPYFIFVDLLAHLINLLRI